MGGAGYDPQFGALEARAGALAVRSARAGGRAGCTGRAAPGYARGMAVRKIGTDAGRAALAAVREAGAAGAKAARADEASAVRYLLELLEEKAPGNSVEVRVPPFGAVQVIEGPRHTRGTPPNVVEMDAATWISLATGERSWAELAASGIIHASGTRADISAVLPVRP